jgi:hypothetical protein
LSCFRRRLFFYGDQSSTASILIDNSRPWVFSRINFSSYTAADLAASLKAVAIAAQVNQAAAEQARTKAAGYLSGGRLSQPHDLFGWPISKKAD